MPFRFLGRCSIGKRAPARRSAALYRQSTHTHTHTHMSAQSYAERTFYHTQMIRVERSQNHAEIDIGARYAA